MEEFFEIYRRIREEIERTLREIERHVEEVLPSPELREGILEPLVYTRETSTEFIISADLPLVRKKDNINVEVRENKLIIEAKLEKDYCYGVDNPFFQSIKVNKYRAVVEIPENIDLEKARARFRDGVLEIHLPKKFRGFRIKVE